jgi:hypothetical protein
MAKPCQTKGIHLISGLVDLKKSMIQNPKEIHDINPSVVPLDDRGEKTCNSTAQRGSFSRYSSMPVISPDEVGDFFAKSQKLGRLFFHMCPIHFYISSQFLQLMINVY